jgi:lysozyme
MRTSRKGIEFIKAHEGLRLDAYLCPAGVPTIGYGHTYNVKIGDRITEEQAEKFLIGDLIVAETEVNRYGFDLTQNQFDALVSFVFNVGAGNFRSSTLLKRLKDNPNDPDIENQFKRWVYGGGKVLQGLIRRRNEEAKLYFT